MASNMADRLPRLGERQREVLRAVILEHLASAHPVPSAVLARRYDFGVSPATLRSELADLEDLGLLTHPHTSAGRVPTDLGYRYFVEALMPRSELRGEERVTLSHQFAQAQRDETQWPRLAAAALARVTAEAAIVTALASAAQLRRSDAVREIYYDGILNILAQPEFDTTARVREMFAVLEDHIRLSRLLPEALREGDVHVSIGGEHRLEPLRGCSLVFARYGAGERTVGYVGVVGPTRMDYPRTIGAVRYVGGLMSDLVRAMGAY